MRFFFGRIFYNLSQLYCSKLRKPLTSGPLLLAGLVGFNEKSGVKQGEGKHVRGFEDIVRHSAVECCTSSTSLLTHTVSQLILLEEAYCEAIDTLIHLTEMTLHMNLESQQANPVWDVILKTRSKLNTIQDVKRELEILLKSSQQMVENAAESAHFTGADYAGIAASQHLHTSLSHLEQARVKTKEKQILFNAIQARSIEQLSKKEKKGKSQPDNNSEKTSSPTSSSSNLVPQQKFIDKHQPSDSPDFTFITPSLPAESQELRPGEDSVARTPEISALDEMGSESGDREQTKGLQAIKKLNIKSVEEDENSVTIKFEDEE